MNKDSYRLRKVQLNLEQIKVRADHISEMVQRAITLIQEQPTVAYSNTLLDATGVAKAEATAILRLLKIEEPE